jgi:hypothetical protein
VIAPVALMFEGGPGIAREVIQPWIDREPDGDPGPSPAGSTGRAAAPINDYLHQVLVATGELFVLDLARSDAQSASRWRELARLGRATGFHRLVRPVVAMADELDRKRQAVRRDPGPTALLAIELAALARLAGDLGG